MPRISRTPRRASPPEPSFTANDIATALAESMSRQGDGEGLTVTDVCEATGWPRATVQEALRRAVARGLVACGGRVYRAAVDGTMRPIPAYRPTRKARARA
jgi:DNA-binding GntR family transcriptional regulator